MANSKKFVVKNGLETQNIQFVEADGTESIELTVLEDGTLSFSGSSGQLFSIADSLTGSSVSCSTRVFNKSVSSVFLVEGLRARLGG